MERSVDAGRAPATNKEALEQVRRRYNRRRFVHPDPLEFLYDYDDVRDREVVGLVASSLAYGRVEQILGNVSAVLECMPRPAEFVRRASWKSLRRTFAGFKHRFTTAEEICLMLLGVKRVLSEYGSLHACFAAGLSDAHETVLPALAAFARELAHEAGDERSSLLPCPTRGSACKRLNLFLRWMVRQDAVDPGGWNDVPPSKLIVPLDTHIHRIALALNLTERKQAGMRTALTITAVFRSVAPDDPVRYDFALTRLGIRRDADLGAFLNRYGMPEAA